MPPIEIVPLGAGALNGEFEINGGSQALITGSTLLDIAGTRQTSTAAAAFALHLQAMMGGTEVGRSAPFAVSDIMFDMSTQHEAMEITPRGIDTSRQTPEWLDLVTVMSKQTDGADGLSSLNQVIYSEKLEVTRETGGMSGFGTGTPFEDALAEIDQYDTHRTPGRHLRAVGVQELMQTHTLSDLRTNSLDIPVANSGFQVIRAVERDPRGPGCLRYVVSKEGMAGTADGVRSNAGSGRAEDTAQLPCTPVPGPGGEQTGPDRDDSDGGTPATRTSPRLHIGPVPPGHVPFGYVSGIPPAVAPGMPIDLIISFAATSTDPARPERRLFTAPIPCIVEGVTMTHVVLRTTNTVPLSLAPLGFSLTVMPPLKEIRVPFSLIF
jgi:hypothetical protein